MSQFRILGEWFVEASIPPTIQTRQSKVRLTTHRTAHRLASSSRNVMQWSFQAPTTQVVLLSGGCRGIHRRAKLYDPCCRVLVASLATFSCHVGIDNGVTKSERALADRLECRAAPQHRPRGGVGAVVIALQSNIHNVRGQPLLGKLRCRTDAIAKGTERFRSHPLLL